MRPRLSQVVSIPLPAGVYPIAARFEIVANDSRENGNRNILIVGCVILDAIEGSAVIPEDEWCGHLAVTMGQTPIAQMFDGLSQKDIVDHSVYLEATDKGIVDRKSPPEHRLP